MMLARYKGEGEKRGPDATTGHRLFQASRSTIRGAISDDVFTSFINQLRVEQIPKSSFTAMLSTASSMDANRGHACHPPIAIGARTFHYARGARLVIPVDTYPWHNLNLTWILRPKNKHSFKTFFLSPPSAYHARWFRTGRVLPPVRFLPVLVVAVAVPLVRRLVSLLLRSLYEDAILKEG